MIGSRTRVVWDAPKVYQIVVGAPASAHVAASVAAAEAAAAAIGGSGSGRLADDVRSPKTLPGLSSQGKILNRGAAGRFIGGPGHNMMASMIGSGLPYARIEHFGGWIEAHTEDAYGRVLLYIRPGDIQATAGRVYHHGKHYLDRATASYMALFAPFYKARFPR